MGVVIFTNKPEVYRVGDFIESADMLYPPTGEGITYIVYGLTMTEKDAIWWSERVPYRLVICPSRKPKLTKKGERSLILDWDEKKASWDMACKSIIQWVDRSRVAKAIKGAPIPLLLAWLKPNNRDIHLWRLLADTSYTLPQRFQEAVMAYGVTPRRGRIQYPKKRKSVGETQHGCRESDIYVDLIVRLNEGVANEVRETNIDALPKGVKKGKQHTMEWI